MAKFSVDTHLFRELGELLVGRESTALVELIKNSYDADATQVTVYGENLGKTSGRILITDDGIGMTEKTFRSGFLRIASRLKETGDRRSPCYKRRYTGAKGVGRLAAQKLAWNLHLYSVPFDEVYGPEADSVVATIDWKAIDSGDTLDDDIVDRAITIKSLNSVDDAGTEIELTNLRGRWTPTEKTRVIHEVTTFQSPEVLLQFPAKLLKSQLLFEKPIVRDVVGNSDPGFQVILEGDFDVGEEHWKVVAEAADWVLEIEAHAESKQVKYCVSPTKQFLKDYPKAEQHLFVWDGPNVDYVPTFHARILIRDGHKPGEDKQRQWMTRTAGVRVYMEGFRVLPYGDAGDDWLMIDSHYSQRQRKLTFLDQAAIDLSHLGSEDADYALSARRNSSYFGAVFLTNEGAKELAMLVNREGFIPNAAFLSLQKLVRVGIDLSVRAKAYETQDSRKQRRQDRNNAGDSGQSGQPDRQRLREAAELAKETAIELAKQSRLAAVSGDMGKAQELIISAGKEIERGTQITSDLVSDRSIMQILAGVGLQMAAFVHEMNALLGMVNAVESAVEKIHQTFLMDEKSRRQVAALTQSIGDLRRVIERQASYLRDVTSPDSRRRRSRQSLKDRFSAAARIVQRAADKRSVNIENKIPEALKSPPMFPAELTVIFSNLLSNAIKACKRGGRVYAKGRSRPDGAVVLTIENTGTKVNLKDAENWFLPFKSTTVEADPILGQGMGMGLPIVRNILEEYGATIQFVEPTADFATAIQVVFK